MTTDPFDDWVDTYRAAGWVGVLPLPSRRKASPPEGFTGAQGAWPTSDNIDLWRKAEGQNIAVRMPPNVIGIDVDTYDGKRGLATFLGLVERLGHPGATWETTSRDGTPDALSAIRWYRLPSGTLSHDMRDPGDDIEIIRFGHRYAIVAPSIHPDGRAYAWRSPNGFVSDTIPGPADLAELPASWCAHLASTTPAAQNEASGKVWDLLPTGHAGTLHNPIANKRDETLAAYTMSCIARGFTKDETYALLDVRIAAVVPSAARFDPFTDKDKDRWWNGAAKKVQYAPTDGIDVAAIVGRKLIVCSAADIPMRVADWLWRHDLGAHLVGSARYQHWIPVGGLTLLGGREGTGKSSWTARLCAQITTGRMEGIFERKPKGVLIAATEDDWSATIIPRLTAARADLARIYRVDVQVSDDIMTGLTLPTDVPAIRQAVADHDVALIVLDPLLSVVDGKLDTHKDAEVRRALEPITRLAADTGTAVLGLIHQNKSTEGDFLTKLMGSRAFSAVARAVLGCAEVEQDEDYKGEPQFIFGQEKNNLGRRVRTGIRYELEDANPGKAVDGREVWTSKVRVVEYKDELTVAEVAAKADEPKRGKSKQRFAMDALRAYLAAQPGRAATKREAVAAVMRAAAECGLDVSASTVDNAKVALGLDEVGATTAMRWVLP